MKKGLAVSIFECLSSPVRLDVYRLLVRKGFEGAVAGEISSTLRVAPSNLSFHLRVLTQAQLTVVQQEGRYQRYVANLPLMSQLVEYLTAECCSEQSHGCDYGGAAAVRGEQKSPVQRRSRKEERVK